MLKTQLSGMCDLPWYLVLYHMGHQAGLMKEGRKEFLLFFSYLFQRQATNMKLGGFKSVVWVKYTLNGSNNWVLKPLGHFQMWRNEDSQVTEAQPAAIFSRNK